ncbi:hypothetical protein [Mycolicibacterium houstonense]|uniref:hypothetical protein n=1 Tax=Mycolicibacterium houstonense TaxID=146021 RepID=UPI003F998235
MEELNCQLSPLVYAELYRLLGTTAEFEDSLALRLDEIGYRLDWLSEATDAYRGKWEYDLQYIDVTTIGDYVLQKPGHALLATWILAGLRNTGHCYDVSSNLAAKVLESATKDIADLRTPLPASLSPTVIGWTLGKLIGREGLPAALAQLPEDGNVRAAFLGLVEHVLHLQTMQEPWPEMMCMAAYWRGYGLAEGMLPGHGSGGPALRQLLAEAQLSMQQSQYSLLHRHFEHFNQRRQAVSHIADDESRPSYLDVIETIKDWSDLRMTVLGLTQFVGQEVSKQLAESPVPRALRGDPWSYLLRDIEVWG